MKYEVILTASANAQLEDIYVWWATNRSETQAARWYNGFLDALSSLRERPERCPLARENGQLPFEAREIHYGIASRPTHRAVFAIRQRQVLVVAIRHLAQADLSSEDL